MIVHKINYNYYSYCFTKAALISQRICAFCSNIAKQGSLVYFILSSGDFCRLLLIAFANSLDPDQDRHKRRS